MKLYRPLSRLLPAAILGVLLASLGLLLSVAPLWLDLEEQAGLGLLFSLRGRRPAPAEVVVVSIDQESADALGDLPADPAKWPRSLHARLTDTLARAGAKVIAFDMFFGEPRGGDEDARFAAAITRARNVVLAKYFSRDTVPLAERDGERDRLNVERVASPSPVLAEASAGAAPFPLPKLPVRLSQYWKFAGLGGQVPSLPAVAFQVFSADAYDDLLELVRHARPDAAAALPADAPTLLAGRHIDAVVLRLRMLFESDPALSAALLEATRTRPVKHRERVRALIRMYQGAHSEYLNFYGPPRTVRTVPYHRVVAAEAAAAPEALGLRGAAIFVGVSDLRREQKDGFNTVFSHAGIDLSGAEVAATAFANLLKDEHVRPLDWIQHAGVILAVGLLVGALCTLFPPGAAAVGLLGLAVGYVVLALSQFSSTHTWLPVTAPLLFQVPGGFVGALLWRYVHTNRERRQMRTVFSRNLPSHVIDDLLRNTRGRVASGESVYGICLATDAERYTSLAESMNPEELAHFVNRYYAVIFEPIRRHGGTISDVIGDAALAIWASAAPDPALRGAACHAACELSAAVDRFNRESTGIQVPTRIGLHSGQMVLGHVGAMDHYEYRAVGDIVNTAARIQELNKRFRTRMLVSDDVLAGLDAFFTRRLGAFVLVGKSKPLVLHELICRRHDATDQQRALVARFAEGVAAYESRSWIEASKAFDAYLDEVAGDEAARFYLNACAECRGRDPDEPWDPVFRMSTK